MISSHSIPSSNQHPSIPQTCLGNATSPDNLSGVAWDNTVVAGCKCTADAAWNPSNTPSLLVSSLYQASLYATLSLHKTNSPLNDNSKALND